MVVNYNFDMFKLSDHIYKLVNDIDLGGQSIGIPAGSILQPEGGRFINGSVVLNGTLLRGVTELSQLVDVTSCQVSGTYAFGQVMYADGSILAAGADGTLKPLSAKFRWNQNVIQISEDGGQTWTDFSNQFNTHSYFAGSAATTGDVATPEEGALYLIGTVQPFTIYLYSNSTWTPVGTLGDVTPGLTDEVGTATNVALTQNRATKLVTEYNIEEQTGLHSLSLDVAIQHVPASLRKKSLKVIFTDTTGVTVTWRNTNASNSSAFLNPKNWERITFDNIFDGGCARSVYGGARTINAGDAEGNI